MNALTNRVERPAPGIEVHHKQTPEAEATLRFAVCVCSEPSLRCWYVQRRTANYFQAAHARTALRRSYNGLRLEERFRIWDTTGPWPTTHRTKPPSE